ncbi:MAG TPA: serine/threonine-protein kinase [Polyangia bacterium]|jgi:predicted Ser/Thr protein kinase|nr:serine/threonine-protein kinase [Polyangia bacterium]
MTAACLDEDTILSFSEGRLAPDRVAALEVHTRGCPACSQLLTVALGALHSTSGAVAARAGAITVPAQEAGATPRAVARGALVGRYLVVGHLGSGGMGDVFAAYDPELDRKIALKLLRAEGEARDERGRLRLLREAKAIAKLSHPNVVVVYDTGTYDDRVFVAMEFIEGQTLAVWLAERPRTRREILAVFSAAGRGLAAAHAAGLVHRDFKPHNVMVGEDGKVRVMDFGLARAIGAADVSATDVAARTGGVSPADAVAVHGNAPLTMTGELMGTPLFMAPEQFKGADTDARTDQFSFCVALYAALYGAHPFPHDSLPKLMSAVLRGEVLQPSAKVAAPTWLRRAVLRGLNVKPDERWPSMEALVRVLEHDPAQSRRRWLAAGVAVVLVVTAGVGVWRAGTRGEALCRRGDQRLAGLWEPSGSGPSHERMRGAFLRTDLSYAAETWGRASATLDRYATSWLHAYRDACEATHVRGEQSAETLDLRMTCLDERLTGLRALVDVLSTADRDTVSRAVDATSALPTLDRCADVKLLREPVEPPRDGPTRARVAALRDQTAVVNALHLTGKHDQAITQGQKLIAEARATGYRPLIAEALVRTWAFEAAGAFPKETATGLREGVWMAIAARRDDVAAEGAAILSGLEGYILARREEGERWTALGNAILDRLGPGHDELRSWLLQNQSSMAVQEGDLDAGLRYAQEALAMKERVLPPGSPDLAETLNSLAEARFARGEIAEALRVNTQARAIYARAYGEGSPWLGKVMSNRGEYLIAAGRPAEAIPVFQDALARWEPQLGAEHPFLAFPLTGLGLALSEVGRPEDALPPLERALRIREVKEPKQPQVAETRFALARALWDGGGDRVRARRLGEVVQAFYAQSKSNPRVAAEVNVWLTAHPATDKPPRARNDR